MQNNSYTQEASCLAPATIPVCGADLPLAIDRTILEAPQLSDGVKATWRALLFAPRFRVIGDVDNFRSLLVFCGIPDAARAQDIHNQANLMALLTNFLASSPVAAWAVTNDRRLLAYVGSAKRSRHIYGYPAHHERLKRRLQGNDWKRFLPTWAQADYWSDDHPAGLPISNNQAATGPSPLEDFECALHAPLRQAKNIGLLSEAEWVEATQVALRREAEILRGVTNWLAGQLESESLDALIRHDIPLSARSYRWLHEASGIERIRRTQAMSLAPFFLSQAMTEDSQETLARLSAAVREGKPVWKFLASEYKTTPLLVRHLAELSSASFQNLSSFHDWRETLVYLLEALPPEWLPKTHEEWEAFDHVAASICAFRNAAENRLENYPEAPEVLERISINHLRKQAKKGWIRASRQLSSLSEVGMAPADCVHTLADNLVRARSEADDSITSRDGLAVTEDIARHLVHWSVERWVKANRRWHRITRTRASDIPPLLASVKWPSLLPPTQFGNRIIEFLTSPKALAEEGDSMSHCVYTRYRACLKGSSHIASLRDLCGERRSTLEVRIYKDESGKDKVECIEHRGYGNAPVNDDCEKAKVLLLEYLSQHLTPTRLDDLASKWAACSQAFSSSLEIVQQQEREKELAMLHTVLQFSF